MGVVGLRDPLEELSPDDAAAAPQHGYRAVVELPVVLLGGRGQLHEALGIAGDLRGVERLADLLRERLRVDLHVRGIGAGEDFACANSLGLDGRHGAGVDRLGDQRARHAEIEGELAHPLAGPLGPGRVENPIDHEVAAVGIFDSEDVAGDLDQIAVELTFVPFVKHPGELVIGKPGGMLEERVGLADQLHVAIFDPVVDHLHVVAGTAGPDPIAAGDVALGADLGGDRLEDLLDQRPRGGGAAGHHARALQRPLFAPRHAGADIEQPLRLDLAGAPVGVGRVGVAAVDEDVPFGEHRRELGDEIVDGRARLDHHHDLPRALEIRHKVLERMAADDVRLLAAAGDEGIGDARRPVVDGDLVAPAGDVEGEVLPHHGQPDQGDVTRTLLAHARAPLGASGCSRRRVVWDEWDGWVGRSWPLVDSWVKSFRNGAGPVRRGRSGSPCGVARLYRFFRPLGKSPRFPPSTGFSFSPPGLFPGGFQGNRARRRPGSRNGGRLADW